MERLPDECFMATAFDFKIHHRGLAEKVKMIRKFQGLPCTLLLFSAFSLCLCASAVGFGFQMRLP